MSSIAGAFDDVKAAHAVDHIDEAAVVAEHVVAAHAIGAGRHVRYVARHLAWPIRIGDVDEAQPLREPGKGDFGVGDVLDRLMAAGHFLVALAVYPVDL